MNWKSLLTGMVVLIFMSATAFADGGFSGRIDYNNCDCNSGDQVSVKSDSSSTTYYYNVNCPKWYYGNYSTSWGTPSTFPPGWYTITLHFGPSSNCEGYGDTRHVYHGTTGTRVNLEVPGNPPP